jgi:hypothetical protein
MKIKKFVVFPRGVLGSANVALLENLTVGEDVGLVQICSSLLGGGGDPGADSRIPRVIKGPCLS